MNYIVETKHLKKYYQMGDTTVKALDGIDFCVKDQEFIRNSKGCTLLYCGQSHRQDK